MAHQGGVEPYLAVVQTELVFADLEILFHGPAHARDSDQGDGTAQGNVAVEVGLIGGSLRFLRTSRWCRVLAVER